MASCSSQGAKLVNQIKRRTRFSHPGNDIGKVLLPRAYLKFYQEWKSTPTTVRCVPKEETFRRDVDPITMTIQNVPMPMVYSSGQEEGLSRGLRKQNSTENRKKSPALRRNVLHSVILNKCWSTVVTERMMNVIDESYGLDHYLLKTPACDLKSSLSLRVKRHMLKALKNNCPDVDADVRTKIVEEYSKYAEQYTPEEVEWYGYTLEQAVHKMNKHLSEERKRSNVADKIEFKSRLIEQLREAGIAEAIIADVSASDADSKEIGETSAWLLKMNPFGEKQET